MKDDIYNRIPSLPTSSLQELEQLKRIAVENSDLPKRNPRNWKMWLRIYLELEKWQKEIHHET